ncbi:MAG: hypothetical protein WKF48_13705 [Solirubrobacteraceae bacterium]
MHLDDLIDARRNGEVLPLGESTEAIALGIFIDRYLEVRSPFDGWMEAPEAVMVAYSRHADVCRAAADSLCAAIRPVLKELLVAVEREERPRLDEFR